MSRKLQLKPIIWIGSSLEDLRKFPNDVRQGVGYALYLAQIGSKHPDAKPLKKGLNERKSTISS